MKTTSALLLVMSLCLMSCSGESNSTNPQAESVKSQQSGPVAEVTTPEPEKLTMRQMAERAGRPKQDYPFKDLPTSDPTLDSFARSSFDKIKEGDFQGYVEDVHPEELKRFKSFVMDIFNSDLPGKDLKNIKTLFAPLASPEDVSEVEEKTLYASFLKGGYGQLKKRNIDIKSVQMKILGQIKESDQITHVIATTIVPRPTPFSFKKKDGNWTLMLEHSAEKMILGLAQMEHFGGIEKVKPAMRLMKILKVKPVGYVKESDEMAQVLCKVESQMKDLKSNLMACYRIRLGQPAWNLLNDGDPKALGDAILKNWQ